MYLYGLSPNDGREIKYYNEVAEACLQLDDATLETATLCGLILQYCIDNTPKAVFFNVAFRPKDSPEVYTLLDRLEGLELSDNISDRDIVTQLTRVIEFIKSKGALNIENL